MRLWNVNSGRYFKLHRFVFEEPKMLPEKSSKEEETRSVGREQLLNTRRKV